MINIESTITEKARQNEQIRGNIDNNVVPFKAYKITRLWNDDIPIISGMERTTHIFKLNDNGIDIGMVMANDTESEDYNFNAFNYDRISNTSNINGTIVRGLNQLDDNNVYAFIRQKPIIINNKKVFVDEVDYLNDDNANENIYYLSSHTARLFDANTSVPKYQSQVTLNNFDNLIGIGTDSRVKFVSVDNNFQWDGGIKLDKISGNFLLGGVEANGNINGFESDINVNVPNSFPCYIKPYIWRNNNLKMALPWRNRYLQLDIFRHKTKLTFDDTYTNLLENATKEHDAFYGETTPNALDYIYSDNNGNEHNGITDALNVNRTNPVKITLSNGNVYTFDTGDKIDGYKIDNQKHMEVSQALMKIEPNTTLPIKEPEATTINGGFNGLSLLNYKLIKLGGDTEEVEVFVDGFDENTYESYELNGINKITPSLLYEENDLKRLELYKSRPGDISSTPTGIFVNVLVWKDNNDVNMIYKYNTTVPLQLSYLVNKRTALYIDKLEIKKTKTSGGVDWTNDFAISSLLPNKGLRTILFKYMAYSLTIIKAFQNVNQTYTDGTTTRGPTAGWILKTTYENKAINAISQQLTEQFNSEIREFLDNKEYRTLPYGSKPEGNIKIDTSNISEDELIRVYSIYNLLSEHIIGTYATDNGVTEMVKVAFPVYASIGSNYNFDSISSNLWYIGEPPTNNDWDGYDYDFKIRLNSKYFISTATVNNKHQQTFKRTGGGNMFSSTGPYPRYDAMGFGLINYPVYRQPELGAIKELIRLNNPPEANNGFTQTLGETTITRADILNYAYIGAYQYDGNSREHLGDNTVNTQAPAIPYRNEILNLIKQEQEGKLKIIAYKYLITFENRNYDWGRPGTTDEARINKYDIEIDYEIGNIKYAFSYNKQLTLSSKGRLIPLRGYRFTIPPLSMVIEEDNTSSLASDINKDTIQKEWIYVPIPNDDALTFIIDSLVEGNEIVGQSDIADLSFNNFEVVIEDSNVETLNRLMLSGIYAGNYNLTLTGNNAITISIPLNYFKGKKLNETITYNYLEF